MGTGRTVLAAILAMVTVVTVTMIAHSTVPGETATAASTLTGNTGTTEKCHAEAQVSDGHLKGTVQITVTLTGKCTLAPLVVTPTGGTPVSTEPFRTQNNGKLTATATFTPSPGITYHATATDVFAVKIN